MLKVKNLLKLVTIKALIIGVFNYFVWECIYALTDRNFLNVKQAMENHIWMKEASVA